jgi:inosine/xanthosine triphosphate pyrophosphatase family protein
MRPTTPGCWAGCAGRADRRARFVSTLVALRHADDPEPLVAFGRWEGEILAAARGEGGFGYDPLMFIPALGRHRGRTAGRGEERAQPPGPGRWAAAHADARPGAW